MRVGIIGAGQLGRMLGLAAHPLGIEPRFLDPSEDPPARIAGEVIRAAYDDPDALARLAEGAEVVTFEFENVPAAAARLLSSIVPVRPGDRSLQVAQDRLAEKRCFDRLGIPVAPYAPVATSEELASALDEIGTPSVLKTRRLGYDGKGQLLLHERSRAAAAWKELGERPCVLEGFVEFQRELSMIAVRGNDGATSFYPLTQNEHRDGILRVSVAPAAADPEMERLARDYAARLLEALDYVGVLALELFDRGGELLANEMAPRVHNSGHWTIEGAATSQFENHLRAITGLPLGSTQTTGASAMFNLIGSVPDPAAVLALPDAHLHLYGKSARPGRKLGHVTLRGADHPTLGGATSRLREMLADQYGGTASGRAQRRH